VIKYAVLALLFQHETHGYELSRQLSLTLKSDWNVKASHVAVTLGRLEQAGLVDYTLAESDAAPDRKVYRLSRSGLQTLREWYLQAEIRDYRMGDSFYLKLVFSLTGAPVSTEEVLLNQRRRLYQELHHIMEMQAQADPHTELPLLLLLETVVVHIEADIRWLDTCSQRIDDLKQYQPSTPFPQPRGRPKQA
jgi:DNA-binding PadR family transcriptional regulator